MKDKDYWEKYDRRTRNISYAAIVLSIISAIILLGIMTYSIC